MNRSEDLLDFGLFLVQKIRFDWDSFRLRFHFFKIKFPHTLSVLEVCMIPNKSRKYVTNKILLHISHHITSFYSIMWHTYTHMPHTNIIKVSIISDNLHGRLMYELNNAWIFHENYFFIIITSWEMIQNYIKNFSSSYGKVSSYIYTHTRSYMCMKSREHIKLHRNNILCDY